MADVKQRGQHQDTYAMERAEINLDDLDAHLFFEAGVWQIKLLDN